jgi:hypothetical protein
MFGIENTITFADIQNGDLSKGVYSIEQIFSYLPKIIADSKCERLIKNGVRINTDTVYIKEPENKMYGYITPKEVF